MKETKITFVAGTAGIYSKGSAQRTLTLDETEI
jgi:hypothetical protein